MCFADKKDVRILDMSVEEGLKLIISMGLVFPEKHLSPETVKQLSQKIKA
jgi:uncharacterized membrane protein